VAWHAGQNAQRWLKLGFSFQWPGVDAGLLLFGVFARFVLDDFFIAFSHCPWRHFNSFSDGEKETEAKKTPFNRQFLNVPSVQFPLFGTSENGWRHNP
jgi:hypothetical protein